MSKGFRVTVTQKDTDKGESVCAWRCPIALATKRAKEAEVVFVFADHLSVTTFVDQKYMSTRFWLSEKAKKFVKDFDSGKRVKPATFVFTPMV
jgi:hypothetical protein